jgi:hypothetical protein
VGYDENGQIGKGLKGMDVCIPDRSSGTENEAKREADNDLQRALNRDMSPQQMDYF